MAVINGMGDSKTDGLVRRLWASFYKLAEALKWKDALRAAVGVGMFAIAAVVLDSQDRMGKGHGEFHQWAQGCLVR